MNAEGAIEPCLEVVRTMIDRTLFDIETKKGKMIDRDILERYFSKTENDAMEKFADDNDLNFRVREDLVKIFDFCADLRKEKE